MSSVSCSSNTSVYNIVPSLVSPGTSSTRREEDPRRRRTELSLTAQTFTARYVYFIVCRVPCCLVFIVSRVPCCLVFLLAAAISRCGSGPLMLGIHISPLFVPRFSPFFRLTQTCFLLKDVLFSQPIRGSISCRGDFVNMLRVLALCVPTLCD